MRFYLLPPKGQAEPLKVGEFLAQGEIKRHSNFFCFLSLYFVSLLFERILKAAPAGSKSYLFLCLFIFQRQAFLETLENQKDDFETVFGVVPKKMSK
jgi:hypothetical protein